MQRRRVRVREVKVELVCRCCGKTFTANYIAKVPYCSKECRKESRRQTCKECGKVYYHSSKSMCCSKECLDKYRNRISIEKRKRVCETCGKEFIMPYMSGKGKRGEVKEGRFCSKKCYGAWLSGQGKPKMCKVYFPICEVCGKTFTARSNRKRFCSRDCRLKYGRISYYEKHEEILKKLREEYEPKPKTKQTCKQCGNSFMGHTTESYCSDICRRKAKQGRKAKRRAEKAGVYYEPVDPLKVFKRDGWRCQLCGKKLKPKHRGTYRDDAPELEHIIPWAQGGEHSYRNTQLACRKCNEEKGSEEMGQLRLFG